MIEQVLDPTNLRMACQHVVRNKGSAGVDGMTVGQLEAYAEQHGHELASRILEGSYLPQPIKGVTIPKSNGKTRLLGVPTVIDRWLQQCVAQVIGPGFDATFTEHSYGFRPGKNAHQCLLQAQAYINAGFTHIVDIDLKNFFDEVNHVLLLQRLFGKVKCRTTMRLIRKWLRAPIEIDGKLVKRRKGVPQGSPLSPLLSNIVLHDLDRELERLGLRYVRYADDFSIYTQSRREAREAAKAAGLFIANKLRLVVNREKSGFRHPTEFEVLGHAFTPSFVKGERGIYQLIPSRKSWDNLRRKLKAVTRKIIPVSFDQRIRELQLVQRGWLGYFRLASVREKLKKLDGWLRNRLRYCIWHDWKRPERKRINLMRMGIPYDRAWAWSRTRMGGWAVAQSPILRTTITADRLRRRGFVSLLEFYLRLAP